MKLRAEIGSFIRFTACHACSFVPFSCHTERKVGEPRQIEFTQASRRTFRGRGESRPLRPPRKFSRSRAPLLYPLTRYGIFV